MKQNKVLSIIFSILAFASFLFVLSIIESEGKWWNLQILISMSIFLLSCYFSMYFQDPISYNKYYAAVTGVLLAWMYRWFKIRTEAGMYCYIMKKKLGSYSELFNYLVDKYEKFKTEEQADDISE